MLAKRPALSKQHSPALVVLLVAVGILASASDCKNERVNVLEYMINQEGKAYSTVSDRNQIGAYVAGENGAFYYRKDKGRPNRFEYFEVVGDKILLKLDTTWRAEPGNDNSNAYCIPEGLFWAFTEWEVNKKHEFNTSVNRYQFTEGTTPRCTPNGTQPLAGAKWVKHFPEVDWGGDFGKADSIALYYQHGTELEIHWYAKGRGWVAWQYFPSTTPPSEPPDPSTCTGGTCVLFNQATQVSGQPRNPCECLCSAEKCEGADGGSDGGSGGGSDGGGGDADGGSDGGGGGSDGGGGGSDGTTPGTSWGDPHIVTFDGLAYDFQGVGEFVALESTAGAPLTVQTRQRPLGTSRRVAINTAVAASLGVDRVAIYVGRSPPLLVNGTPATLADGATLNLAGGGKVSLRGGTYTLTWPASTVERVEVAMFSDHLDLRPALLPARKGQVRGIFGNFNDSQSDDVATRAGTVLSSPTFQEFYGTYVESWRITQAESLFDYPTGESTDTFTDRTFPDQFVGTRDLTEDQRTAARQTCTNRGITDPALLDSCTLDVALSGDSTYANSAATAQPPSGSYDMLVNLAANRPVTATGTIDGNPGVVTNTVFAPEGQDWRDLTYVTVIPSGTSLTVDLGAVYSLARVVVQADNNDTYLVESSIDGVTWSPLANIPTYGGAGLRTRPMVTLPSRVNARYARLQATSGDSSYSVSELELYGPVAPASP